VTTLTVRRKGDAVAIAVAGIEFDTSSGPPIVVQEFKREGKANE